MARPLALSCTKVRPPETAVGEVWSARTPLPSCPVSPAPQHQAVPVLVRPQVWSPPAVRLLNLSPPTTAVGVRTGLSVVPIPSEPYWLKPQHQAAPWASSAQVWVLPVTSVCCRSRT